MVFDLIVPAVFFLFSTVPDEAKVTANDEIVFGSKFFGLFCFKTIDISMRISGNVNHTDPPYPEICSNLLTI